MSSLSDITGYLTRWIDSVAAFIVGALSSLGTRKRVQVVEEDDGSFVFQQGAGATPAGLPFWRGGGGVAGGLTRLGPEPPVPA